MSRLQQLEEKVNTLYQEKNPSRAGWTDWFVKHHVIVVANYATALAKKYKVNEELARAAALLHDIADTCTKREDKDHGAISLTIARQIMRETGYSEDEIKLVVDDAIRYHSCHNNEHPQSLEGKILATADSMAHLKTDFYVFAAWAFGRELTLEELKQWVLKKIERDLHKKIFFEEVRAEVLPDYIRIKEFFSR
ncbi:MAG: HD domain-containing protein [Candidatus Levyibacteriota bacterium]